MTDNVNMNVNGNTNYPMPSAMANIGGNSSQNAPLKVPRKRKRTVISCTECHRRKQKCDRGFPCANCVSRDKESLCRYENEAARKRQLMEESVNPAVENNHGYLKAEEDSAAQVSALGYANGSNTTLGIFKKIEDHDADDLSRITYSAASEIDRSGLAERYKTQTRLIPHKDLTEKLVQGYFREANLHYYPLDEGMFRELLNKWHDLSVADLKTAPMKLSPDLQFFPALLFQVLALGLQFQPPDYDSALDTLKYAKGMSFDDLANDYCESGKQILCMLGKKHTTLITVQAGFLRTSYLKNRGDVTESWHYLSQTIRDAQEIGLDNNSNDRYRRKPDETAGDILEDLWEVQVRRRMWTILAMWDIHMAILLGRKTTIDPRDGQPKFPIDSPIPKNRREVAPTQRLDTDPPTPLTMLLWSAELTAPLWAIFNLQREDKHQSNIEKVEQMHQDIEHIQQLTPGYFRSQNPDIRFDFHPGCMWLQRARPTFKTYGAFTLMALHRPYVFTSAASRTKALQAALDILRAQLQIFNLIKAKDYKLFSLVLNTFDAIVLTAAIYILHPLENRDDLDSTLQHFEWGMDRFETMSSRNSMAKSALGVLKGLHVRLNKALNINKSNIKPLPSSTHLNPLATISPPMLPTASYSNTRPSYSTPHNSVSSTSSNLTSESKYTQPTEYSEPPSVPDASAWGTYPGSVSLSETFDFSTMPPLQPMRDLVYSGLSTIGEPQMLDPQLAGIDANQMGMSNAWQFGGDFGSDSFWGYMNTYNP